MKCPNCNKEIEELMSEKDSFLELFVMNSILPILGVAFLIQYFKDYEHQLLLLMVSVGVFYMVYCLLYYYKKVKGVLLIYNYWIRKEVR